MWLAWLSRRLPPAPRAGVPGKRGAHHRLARGGGVGRSVLNSVQYTAIVCSSDCGGWSVNLAEWARRQGVHPQTAYRWFREGMLPVPAVRMNSRSILVAPDTALGGRVDGVGLYARVASH